MRKTLIAVLPLTVLAELLVEKHPHFDCERFFGIYALFGFFACVALIVIAKAIGVILKRPDSYYHE